MVLDVSVGFVFVEPALAVVVPFPAGGEGGHVALLLQAVVVCSCRRCVFVAARELSYVAVLYCVS